MPELAYVNGRIGPVEEARVSVEDRGYQFADGVYEVARSYNFGLIDLDRHLARLERSAAMLDMDLPMPLPGLERTCLDLYARSGIAEGILYVQVTRGAARRQHAAPPGLKPTLVITVRTITKPTPPSYTVISFPNIRWKLCACKSIALLPTVLAKHAAAKAGADEAVFVEEDGTVLEAASSNVFAVKDGELYTPPADGRILEGITRGRVIELAEARGLRVNVESFDLAFLKAADEAFITSSVLTVVPVVAVDGQAVGDGRPGPVSELVLRDYWEFIKRVTASASA